MNDEIILLDEMGNEKEFKVLSTFGVNDIDYAALLSTDSIEDLIYILRIEYDDENQPILVGVDDDKELEYAIEVYEEIQEEKLQ